MAEGKYQPSILVRSEDRTPSSTGSHDFQVATRKPLKGRYLVSYLQIPASAYSVSTTNNVVYFNEPAGGGALTATLTPGNYSISSRERDRCAHDRGVWGLQHLRVYRYDPHGQTDDKRRQQLVLPVVLDDKQRRHCSRVPRHGHDALGELDESQPG